jgi:hypothetical protein
MYIHHQNMTPDVVTWNDTLVDDILNISNPKDHLSPQSCFLKVCNPHIMHA